MAHSSNDNQAPDYPASRDAHGRAALLLTESLIHGLIKNAVLDNAEAIEIIDVAASVLRELSEEGELTPSSQPTSFTLLEAMSKSLALDII